MKNKVLWVYFSMPFVLLIMAVYLRASDFFNDMMPNTYAWHDLCFWMILLKTGFPLFLSLFGIAFLKTDIQPASHKIKFLYIPFSVLICVLFWVGTSLLVMHQNGITEFDKYILVETMGETLLEPQNMCFYYLCVVLFACWPILQKIAQLRNLAGYAALLFFFIGILNTFLSSISIFDKITLFTSQLNWGDFTAYGFYLFVGIWISEVDISDYMAIPIFSIGVASTVAAFVCTVNSVDGMDFSNCYIDIGSPFMAIIVVTELFLLKAITEKTLLKLHVSHGSKIAFFFVPGLLYSSNIVVEKSINLDGVAMWLIILIHSIFSWGIALMCGVFLSHLESDLCMLLKKEWNRRIGNEKNQI